MEIESQAMCAIEMVRLHVPAEIMPPPAAQDYVHAECAERQNASAYKGSECKNRTYACHMVFHVLLHRDTMPCHKAPMDGGHVGCRLCHVRRFYSVELEAMEGHAVWQDSTCGH